VDKDKVGRWRSNPFNTFKLCYRAKEKLPTTAAQMSGNRCRDSKEENKPYDLLKFIFRIAKYDDPFGVS